MGGIGFSEVVQAVVGVGGMVGSTVAAKSQAKTMNQLMNEGSEQRGRVAGIDEYFLGGGRASQLNIPGMQDQFAEVDFAVQEQLRNIDSQAQKSRQMISDNIPQGGAKLRALADLAMKTQEERGKVIREAQTRKRDLDTELTNQYLQQAMNRPVGMTSDAKMYSALRDYEGRQRDISALGTTLGTLAEKAGQTQGQGIEYVPPRDEYSVPGAMGGAPTTGFTREDYLNDPLLTGPREPEYPWKQKVKPEIRPYNFPY